MIKARGSSLPSFLPGLVWGGLLAHALHLQMAVLFTPLPPTLSF